MAQAASGYRAGKKRVLVLNRVVGRGETLASKSPSEVLKAEDVVSGVAICIHDPAVPAGGIAYALLPDSRSGATSPTSAIFADAAVRTLVSELRELGATPGNCSAHVVGGADLIGAIDESLSVGRRNVDAACKGLRDAGVRLEEPAAGGLRKRSVALRVRDGEITIEAR